ncbi:MAG: hypothetical protein HYS13_16335 [Planctomycetia bacterium]|nr:hypothetical protein [Planctomycetia bacterium]
MHTQRPFLDCALEGVTYYYATSLIVVVGAVFGATTIGQRNRVPAAEAGVLGRFANWDGVWYRQIAEDGYSNDPTRLSSVGFFPAYPLVARVVADVTRTRVDWSLLLVSHGALLATFVLLGRYVQERFPREGRDLVHFTLLAFGLVPTTFFFRMAYTESLFCLFTTLSLLGMHRRWHPLLVAVVVGSATATRLVGIALVPAFCLYAWRHPPGPAERDARDSQLASGDFCAVSGRGGRYRAAAKIDVARRLLALGLLVAVAMWGLIAFITFQWVEFGDPLAVVKTQTIFALRHGQIASMGERLLAAMTLEPIWATYWPGDVGYWGRYDPRAVPVLSLQFANPLFFCGTIVVIAIGCWRRRLTTYEWLSAALLLLIPYVLRSHDNAMAGFGRFSAVVIPVYPVLGWLLLKLEPGARCAILCVSAFFLGAYAAMFAANYWFV